MIRKFILLSTLITNVANADSSNWIFKTDIKFESSNRFLSATVPIDGSSTTLSYSQNGKEVNRNIIIELLGVNKDTVDLNIKIKDNDGVLISSTNFLNALICRENESRNIKSIMKFIPYNNEFCKQYFDIKTMNLKSKNINSVVLNIPESKNKDKWNIINFTYSKSLPFKDKPSLIQIRPLCGKAKDLCHYQSSGSPFYIQNEGIGFSKFRIIESETLTGLHYKVSTDTNGKYEETGVIDLDPVHFKK